MLEAQLAAEELMLLAHVLLQVPEEAEGWQVRAPWALMLQQLPVQCKHLSICKIDVIFLLVLELMDGDQGKSREFLPKDHLAGLFLINQK